MTGETDEGALRSVLVDNVGLSPYEVDVYLALLRRGRQTMSELSSASDVPQQRVYDTVETLRERGFVQTVDDHPAEAYAIEPTEVISPIRNRLESAEKSLESLYESVDDVEGGVRVFSSASTIRRYVERVVDAAETTLLILVPVRSLDVLDAIQLPEDVNIQLLVAGLDGLLHDDQFDADLDVPAAVDELRGVMTDEPLVLVADGTTCFVRLDSEDDEGEGWGYYVANPELAFMIDRYLVQTRWSRGIPHETVDSGRDEPEFPSEYVRIGNCLADLDRAARTRPLESFSVAFEGYEVESGEPVSAEGTLVDYYHSEHDRHAYVELELDESDDGTVVRVGGWKALTEDYEARRFTIFDRTREKGFELDAETRAYLDTCREWDLTDVESQSVVTGLDGYVDRMREFVDSRGPGGSYKPLLEFESVKERLVEASSMTRSPTFEWVETETKPGGHPAHAGSIFSAFDYDVSMIGTFGEPTADPFQLAFPDADFFSVGNPSTTDYVQFETGKLLIQDRDVVAGLDYETIRERVTMDALAEAIDGASLMSLSGWGTVPSIPSILECLVDEVWPLTSSPPEQILLMAGTVELLSETDLPAGIATLDEVDSIVPITLVTTRKQALHYAHVFGEEPTNSIPRLADIVQRRLNLSRVAVHTPYEAALATERDTIAARGHLQEFTYGSGNAEDHFAAGFAIGQLEGLSDGASLVLGNATASYHNQFGSIPDPDDLDWYLTEYDELPNE
ncbi:hypothetical protein CV102_15810 [Natronococcus pandeyae]|uniref:TrmB family transcriptional regulator n=1 Tax=Natronococcus pandeyae TaxID=2055836 RepID=A0A8J8Q1X3_9EURY|nr:TrmB family transcriptional regulator sugar-binding domain-containing protein [Natronococcus pandeyae]TYL37802.1 hypothetical protein CV102_15810 [Natronococcus pandeyae]